MLVLGIETSCDETGIALFDSSRGLLSQRLHSQVAMHSNFGGVVPELASRDHIRRVIPLIEEVMDESGCSLSNVDAIAVTSGPGLGGALLAGTSIAAGLGLALDLPVVPVHHLEGHLLSPLMTAPRPQFPFVALLVSGGHTQLMAVSRVGDYRLLGETVDDAAGEAFDKVASLLGLAYPGGPALSRLAADGRADRFAFPRPMLHSANLDFSFSGLKTAVATRVQRLRGDGGLDSTTRADLAAGFQAAVVDVLVAKSVTALDDARCHALVVSGGVGANHLLRTRLTADAAARGYSVFFPPLELCTDNGAMIAHAAALRISAEPHLLDAANLSFNVRPRWELGSFAR